MTKRFQFGLLISLLILAVIVGGYYLLPFGPIPRLPFPNCGPEHRAWLNVRIHSREEFLAYLQDHELELFSGSHTPHLGPFPPEWQVSRLDVELDWDGIAQGIQVEQRLGYAIYSITYSHPMCGAHQTYRFRLTSFGQASLYGCCGI